MASQRQRITRAAATNSAGVALILVALAVSFLATNVRDNAHLVPGISTASDVPGTCHHDYAYFEIELASAELTPAVPCTTQHTSETLWTRQLTGILAAQPIRPTPEMLAGQYQNLCQDAKRLGLYLGQDSPGFPYNLVVYNRYPSAPEWRAGLRTVRCVGTVFYHVGLIRPTISFQLRGSWNRKESATIRLCANTAKAFLPCDRPHIEEVLEPVDPFPATQLSFPSPSRSRQLGRAPCTAAALALLGTKSVPRGLQVIVEPAEIQNWPHSHLVGCRIASAERTGTLEAGLE